MLSKGLNLTALNERTSFDKSLDGLDARLGERIRHRRRAQKMSLKDLAENSSISIGLLSQIERGLSSPSLRVLATLANALKIGLADLFDNVGSEIAPTDQIVIRARDRKKLTFGQTGISKELLTPAKDKSTLDIFMVGSIQAAQAAASSKRKAASSWKEASPSTSTVPSTACRKATASNLQALDSIVSAIAAQARHWSFGLILGRCAPTPDHRFARKECSTVATS
jgi:transcriptional regulator with XRE-family HTH domain